MSNSDHLDLFSLPRTVLLHPFSKGHAGAFGSNGVFLAFLKLLARLRSHFQGRRGGGGEAREQHFDTFFA